MYTARQSAAGRRILELCTKWTLPATSRCFTTLREEMTVRRPSRASCATAWEIFTVPPLWDRSPAIVRPHAEECLSSLRKEKRSYFTSSGDISSRSQNRSSTTDSSTARPKRAARGGRVQGRTLICTHFGDRLLFFERLLPSEALKPAFALARRYVPDFAQARENRSRHLSTWGLGRDGRVDPASRYCRSRRDRSP